ncbi:MAG: CdaR family protein, partial [Defluviitaleaceae bacterium]|nr:CdaR family protein [Defluviitaleaceae bacterium]
IKNIGLTRTATGSPAINYTLTNIQLDPDNIDVVGNEETLLELDTILISDINIANRSDSFTMSFDIRQYLPEGVYLRRGESSIVDAFITIEEFAIYSFSIPRHQITLIGLFHLPYQIVGTDALNIRLRGPESALKNINILTLYPRINLYGYSEGEHSVLLSLTLPANVILLDGPVTIDVVILPNINDHNEDETEN